VVPGEISRGAAGGALKRGLIALAVVVLALAVLFFLVPLGRSPREPPALLHGRAESESHGKGALRAGAARVPIPIGDHPVMAGYPGHRRAEEPGELVFARAIALEAGGVRAYVASIDTLLIPGELEEEVLRRADLSPRTCLLLSATHTHSGPGGAWNSTIAGWAGAGAFDPAQRDAIAQAAAQALRLAAADLKGVDIAIARETWPQGPARVRSDGPIDPTLTAVRLSRLGGPEVAKLVVYAMHPTSAPRSELRISADWPGALASALESTAPALVLQGAVGNTTWDRASTQPGARVAAEVARLLASEALRRSEPDLELSCETRIVALPPAEASPREAWFLRTAQANLFALELDRFAVQTRLQLGSLTLLGVPGEPVGELGLAARPAVLIGLADGYFGYVETEERWTTGAGESGRTWFGPHLARALGLSPR
jgi:hypothetical protein